MRISDWSSDVCSSDLANAYYDVTGAFQLRGSLNWNRNRFGTFVGQCFSGQTADEGCVAAAQDFTGRAPTRSPDWAGNIGATYVADLGDQTLTLTGDAIYTSSYYGAEALSPGSYQPDFWRLNASARFDVGNGRSEEHTSELQSLMRNSYAGCCL